MCRITTFVVSTVANGVIFAQVLYYWNSGAKAAGGKKKKQQPKADQVPAKSLKAKAKKEK